MMPRVSLTQQASSLLHVGGSKRVGALADGRTPNELRYQA